MSNKEDALAKFVEVVKDLSPEEFEERYIKEGANNMLSSRDINYHLECWGDLHDGLCDVRDVISELSGYRYSIEYLVDAVIDLGIKINKHEETLISLGIKKEDIYLRSVNLRRNNKICNP